MPVRILTKQQRYDPFSDPPPITDNDLTQGMMNLVNRGMIPKDVDLTPAFARGVPSFSFRSSTLFDKPKGKLELCASQPTLPSVKQEDITVFDNKRN